MSRASKNELSRRGQVSSNAGGDIVHLIVARVFGSWPKEAFQPVPFSPRHHVHMKMGNALADRIVHGNERALRFECRFDRPCYTLNGWKERGYERQREPRDRFDVGSRDHQNVPMK